MKSTTLLKKARERESKARKGKEAKMMYESDPWEFQLLAAVARKTVEIKSERDGLADAWGRPTEVVLSLREQLLASVKG